MRSITIRQHADRFWPANPDPRIRRVQTVLGLGSKRLIVNVDQLTFVAEGLEPVCKTGRYDDGARIIATEDL